MWQELIGSLISSRWKFEWRYWRGQTPWDTQITPPEVMEFISQTQPGKALDLGCGTGTNAVTLARHGWQVTGVDFAPKAIRQARRKAAAKGLKDRIPCRRRHRPRYAHWPVRLYSGHRLPIHPEGK